MRTRSHQRDNGACPTTGQRASKPRGCKSVFRGISTQSIIQATFCPTQHRGQNGGEVHRPIDPLVRGQNGGEVHRPIDPHITRMELEAVKSNLVVEKRRCVKLGKALSLREDMLRYVSSRLPNASISTVLLNESSAELISSFMGIKDVLMLRSMSRGMKKALTGRPEIFGYAGAYQFDSRHPEFYTLQFCALLLREKAALKTLRISFSLNNGRCREACF